MAKCQSEIPVCYELLTSGVRLNRGLRIEIYRHFVSRVVLKCLWLLEE